MTNYFYQSNYIKYTTWIGVLGLLSLILFIYVVQNTILVSFIAITILLAIIEIFFSKKPIVSIDTNEVVVYGYLGVHPIWSKLQIPLPSIVRVDIQGKSFFTKKIIITYRDQNSNEKSKLIYSGYLNNPDLFQQLLFNAKAPSKA